MRTLKLFHGPFMVLVLATSLAGTAATAAIIPLSGVADGDQANAGVGTGSPATGSIELSLDDATNTLTWTGSFSGLLGDFTIAHLHGPALANQNAGVQVGTAVVLDGGSTTSGATNGAAVLTGGQVGDLLNGLWYWNVHSTFAPGGEIRANISVVPEPSSALLLGLGLAGLARVRFR